MAVTGWDGVSDFYEDDESPEDVRAMFAMLDKEYAADKPPEKLTETTLDFTGSHFLDHTFWQCRNEPGGRLRHLHYRWKYQWCHSFYAATLCPLGLHGTVNAWRDLQTSPTRFLLCVNCGRAGERDTR